MGVLGLLICVVGLPLAAGRVKRNPWYGFRTPKTLSSDEVWYPANRYAGRALAAAGIATAGLSVLTLPLAWLLPVEMVNWFALVILMVPLGWAVVRCFVYLSKL
ncbi:MAG: SdpI family protein [Fimbriimonadia bacterium]